MHNTGRVGREIKTKGSSNELKLKLCSVNAGICVYA